MTRLIIIISIVTFFSCQTNSDSKAIVTNNKTTDKMVAEIAPKFYAGDSSLTLSFKIDIDSVFAYSRNPDIKNFERTTVTKSKDSIIINVRKILTESLYNGACEIHADTIVMNYWIDSLSCVSMQSPFILTYKIKKTKYSHLKLNYVDNRKAPLYKYCED